MFFDALLICSVGVKAVENPDKNLIGGFILGEPDFLNWLKETFLSSGEEDKEIPQLKGLRPRLVLEVCKEFAIDKEAVIKKGKKRNKFSNVSSATITMAQMWWN